MKKCAKITHTCGETAFATCTNYEGTVNSGSEYTNDDCLSIEETTQDLYNQLDQHLDLSDLGESCLEYVTLEGKIYVKNVLLKLEEEICNLKEQVQTLENRQICDMPVGDCVTNFQCLQGQCDNDIITYGDLLNAIVTRICD